MGGLQEELPLKIDADTAPGDSRAPIGIDQFDALARRPVMV